MDQMITVSGGDQLSQYHFSSEAGQDARVSDTETYVKVSSVNRYKFMDDAYYSAGGFRDGTYLIPHTREMFYRARRELSAYRNFMRPIIRSLVEPVFEEDVIRKIAGQVVDDDTVHPYATFLEDVDNDQTCMNEFSEEVMLQTRLHGVSFVVMDNYPEESQPATAGEATESRIMPYVYKRSAQDVDNWHCNPYGRLVDITFVEEPVINTNGTVEQRFRTWTEEYSVLCAKDASGKYVEVAPRSVHGLGVLPVIVLYAQPQRVKSNILVDPPMYDIARMCCVLFNKDSEIRDQERAQAFSNFYMQGDPNGNTSVGPHNVIFVPMEATIAPGFASPDSSILAGLVSNAEKLQQSIFQQAEQSGVIGVKSAESGVAAEWHFWSVEGQLQHTAHLAERLEDEIAELYMAYTRTEFEFDVTYPEEYQPGDQKTVIDRFKVILDLKPVPTLAGAIWKKIAHMTLSDESAEELAIIEDEIDKDVNKPAPVPLPSPFGTVPPKEGMRPEDMPDGDDTEEKTPTNQDKE